MERNERRDYLHAINDVAKKLNDESLKAVYETALLCQANERQLQENQRKKETDYGLY